MEIIRVLAQICLWISIIGFGICAILYIYYIILKNKEVKVNEWQSSPKSSYSHDMRKKTMPAFKILHRNGSPSADEWYTYIAGTYYHTSIHDIGGFCGWVENDKENEQDPNAMAIYNNKGKHLGFIPAKELSDYRNWCDAEPQPCVGLIYVEEGQIRGRVKILRPCNKEFLETEFSKYLNWVNKNYGPDYLPKEMGMQFDVK